MCVIAIAYLASRHYPLIVAANRDERHDRPATPAAWWSDRPGILSGRDLLAGGTWLGISTTGRFAAVTNVVEAAPAAAELSRGTLVGDFLVSAATATDYVRTLQPDAYGPFNLLLIDRTGLQFASNRRAGGALGAGVHAFSNNAPGEDWPKVRQLGTAVQTAVTAAEAAGSTPDAGERIATDLLVALAGPDARGTLAAAPASLFVVGEHFGTRCATVLVIDAAGEAVFVEQSFAPDGRPTDLRRFRFAVPGFVRKGPGV